jgi:DNA modification methylase
MKVAEKPESNSLLKVDAAFHHWYRFVLSYPPHLVRKYVDLFALKSSERICDPFCGTGTTLVEAKKLGFSSIGVEAHPFAAMVSRVKCNWSLNLVTLRKLQAQIARRAEKECSRHALPPHSFETSLLHEDAKRLNGYALDSDSVAMIPLGFMSDRPLGRLLILRHIVDAATKDEPRALREFFYVAFAHIVTNGAGNFAFGPEIYRTKPKTDYDVVGHFTRHTSSMISDLEKTSTISNRNVFTRVFEGDARNLIKIPGQIDSVITSPPYPNEKDYTRTTRVESVLLGFVSGREQLRGIKNHLLRSNTRNVFASDDDADEVSGFDSIRKVCEMIENRRIELSKTSGFERLYHKVVAHYFGGMKQHFRALKPKLRSKAKLAYVVGDQYSFLMVPIHTAKLLAEVAESEGYKVTGIDLWRERIGTKVRNGSIGQKVIRIREEVLRLETP